MRYLRHKDLKDRLSEESDKYKPGSAANEVYSEMQREKAGKKLAENIQKYKKEHEKISKNTV